MCCDTMVALGPATLDGSVLFTKMRREKDPGLIGMGLTGSGLHSYGGPYIGD